MSENGLAGLMRTTGAHLSNMPNMEQFARAVSEVRGVLTTLSTQFKLIREGLEAHGTGTDLQAELFLAEGQYREIKQALNEWRFKDAGEALVSFADTLERLQAAVSDK